MSIKIRPYVTHYHHIWLTAALKFTRSDNISLLIYAFLILKSRAGLAVGMNKSYGKQKTYILKKIIFK